MSVLIKTSFYDRLKVKLVGGEYIYAHGIEKCNPDPCCIHNPSEHHMRLWPQHWRADRGIMERTCPHGVGHPDPDDISNTDKIHGCDGCCRGPLHDTTEVRRQ